MQNLSGLVAACVMSVYCCTALASDDANRDFIRQQEVFSQQLQHQDNSPVRRVLEQQVRQNPLSASDARFIDELKQRQQGTLQDKPTHGALYFVSFSVPQTGLARILTEVRQFRIPALLRGMVNNDMKATAGAVMTLVKNGTTPGIAIDPTQYRRYSITSVPALVVYCESGYDVIRGNLHVKQALEKAVEKGDCAAEAQRLLNKGEGK